MVLSFSVENFRSLRDLQVLDLEAKPLQAGHPGLAGNVATVEERYGVLKSKVIYGANASGKSNLLMALSLFNFAVTLSWNPESIVLGKVEPFALSNKTNRSPSFFEIRVIAEGVPYRYGFMVAKGGLVVSEWLFGTPGKKEVPFFTRDEDGFTISATHLKGVRKLLAGFGDVRKFVSDKSLLLSLLGHYQNEETKAIYGEIARMRIVNAALATGLDDQIIHELMDDGHRMRIWEILSRADIELGEMRSEPGFRRDGEYGKEVTLMGDTIQKREHNLFVVPEGLPEDSNRGFLLESYLSKGTIKLLQLASSIIKTLDEGDCLVIDEFEARLHTKISRAIIRMFHEKDTNPRNAQLIVATHDTNLLSPLLLRRDQITFVEKDKTGASSVYSLADIRGVRPGAPYEKEYLSGKYGGAPTINVL